MNYVPKDYAQKILAVTVVAVFIVAFVSGYAIGEGMGELKCETARTTKSN